MAQSVQRMVIPTFIQKRGTLDQQGAEEQWKTLEDAMHQIFRQNGSQLSFQTLYTSGYLIILHKHGDFLYENVERTIREHVKKERDDALEQPDSTFLEFLLDKWEKYRVAIGNIRDVLMYMDRNYSANMKKLLLFDLGIKIFGEEMLKEPRVMERMRVPTLEIIHQERSGEQAPRRMLLKSLTKMMTEVNKKTVYEPCLEAHFLADSEEYYRNEASRFFSISTTPDYVRKVLKRLEEEKNRVESCLHQSTQVKIVRVITKVMIDKYKMPMIDKENSGARVMLVDWQIENLRLLYECLQLVEEGVEIIIAVVRDYLMEEGSKYVNEQEAQNNPLGMVESIVQLRDQYHDLLHKAFSDREDDRRIINVKMENAVRKAFEDIVNKNPRFPEYLSLYVDSKMKKGKSQIREEEYDAVFDKVLVLFRLLREKDVFEKYYKNHLAKRLLGQKSCSDDAERAFIWKLKTEYGYQFVSKLEGMFQDMKLSEDTMGRYKNHLSNLPRPPAPFELAATVLTTGYWPVTRAPSLQLPVDLEASCRTFKNFYLNSHTGRKLHFQLNMGNADLRYAPSCPLAPSASSPLRHATSSNHKKYELNVSTYQMTVLLLFNSYDTLTLGKIMELTKIPLPDLKRNVVSLCLNAKTHTKILDRSNMPGAFQQLQSSGTDSASMDETGTTSTSSYSAKDMDENTQFTFNSDFKSKFVKVKVSPVVIREDDSEGRETRVKVDEDRKWQVDAAIVRVMKSRKTVEHRILIIECIKLLQGRFTPSPDDIKKRIESLIEREYMERSKESRSRYNYLA